MTDEATTRKSDILSPLSLQDSAQLKSKTHAENLPSSYKKRQHAVDSAEPEKQVPVETNQRPQRIWRHPDQNRDFDKAQDVELDKSEERKAKRARLNADLGNNSQKLH
ncbi:hypothetical protein K439DRAFT_1621068 [Ramaria rubella]|nr:hypothetical protein K439DRAFT_1621068 [Ramaria rubella]